MNSLTNTHSQRVMIYLVGMALGSVAGYLVAEVVVDRVLFGAPEEIQDEDVVYLKTQDAFNRPDKDLVLVTEVKKSSEAKPNLAELIRDYTPNPVDDTSPGTEFLTERAALLRLQSEDLPLQVIEYYSDDGVYVLLDQNVKFQSLEVIDDPEEFLPRGIEEVLNDSTETSLYCWNTTLGVVFRVDKIELSYKEKLATLTTQDKPSRSSRRTTLPKAKVSSLVEELADDDGRRKV